MALARGEFEGLLQKSCKGENLNDKSPKNASMLEKLAVILVGSYVTELLCRIESSFLLMAT